MQIKVKRTICLADVEKLEGGSYVNILPGTYDLETATLPNPRDPRQTTEFYRVPGTKGVIAKQGLEKTLAENYNSIENEYEAEVNKRRKRNELKDAIALKINRLDLAQMEKLEAFLEQL